VLDTVYISQVFPLCPADAIEATESWYRHLGFAPGGRRLVGGHRLYLRPRFEPTDFDPLLLRRLRGTLWVGWWWPVRIELELVTYSRSASEIALRPSTVRWPVAIERYGEDADRAVKEVVAAITIDVSVSAEQSVEPSERSVRCAGRVRQSTSKSLPDRIAGHRPAYEPTTEEPNTLRPAQTPRRTSLDGLADESRLHVK
jgi:hypothetical protein